MGRHKKEINIDKYLEEDGIELLGSTIATEEVENKIEAEVVDNEELTNEELTRIIEAKEQACANYEQTIEELNKKHEITIKNLEEHYSARIKELTSLLGYYERKLNVIKDIITIETGGEK